MFTNRMDVIVLSILCSIVSGAVNADLFAKLSDDYVDGLNFEDTPKGKSNELEDKMGYFREDIGVNAHHNHWHVAYPFMTRGKEKDRGGELFYYMHQQILARYNADRLSVGLNRTRKDFDPTQPLLEPYDHQFTQGHTTNAYGYRYADLKVKTANQHTANIILEYRENVRIAIREGTAIGSDGTNVSLINDQGIDLLGNILEPTDLTVNPSLYGDIHNTGHNLIAEVVDEASKSRGSLGVMSKTSTAMRDPLFYVWHTFINEIFMEFKEMFPPYTNDELSYDRVEVLSLDVTSQRLAELGVNSTLKNQLITYFQVDKVKLLCGIDFSSRAVAYLNFPHLQHIPFDYNITVRNNGSERNGTVRIFLAPTNDESGKPFKLEDQRNLFIEMDKFTVTLKANNITVIERSSKQSTVAIDFNQMVLDIEEYLTHYNVDACKSHCGCGWPHYMLVPRGESSAEGMPFKLFVMISDYEKDKADDDAEAHPEASFAYCGIPNKNFPDKQQLGFPFDRRINKNATYIDQFLTSNMKVSDVKIFHKNRILVGQTIITE